MSKIIENSHTPLIQLNTEALDKIKFTEVKEDLPNINYHHVHHYSLMYIIIGLAILIYIAYKYPQIFKCCHKPTTTQSFEVTLTPTPARRRARTQSSPQND